MSEIERAVEILRRGGLVAFPTETVYGLGADATNADAVQRIFHAKGRPSTNPLICHVADEAIAKRYAAEWPLASSRLVERFWPGPLTLVVRKSQEIVPEATAGLNTVGLRAPDHPLTLELLRQFDRPLIAGPSANKSSRVSPTTAQHVRDEFGDAIDLILDGGPCVVGIESTVLDLSGDRPAILRPGGITQKEIEDVIGSVELKCLVSDGTTPTIAPGQHPVHYAPRAKAFRFDPHDSARVQQICMRDHDDLWTILRVGGQSESLSELLTQGLEMPGNIVYMPDNPRAYAHHLYHVFHEIDRQDVRKLYVEMPPDTPEWAAVRDRLIRATKPLP